MGHTFTDYYLETAPNEEVYDAAILESEFKPLLACLRNQNSIRSSTFTELFLTAQKNALAQKDTAAVKWITKVKRYPLPEYDQIDEILPDLVSAYALKKWLTTEGAIWSIQKKRAFAAKSVVDLCESDSSLSRRAGIAIVSGSPHPKARDRIEKIIFPALREFMGCPVDLIHKNRIIDCLEN